MPMNIKYVHKCPPESGCTQIDQEFEDKPTSRYGVSYLVRPVCEASGAELVEVSRVVF